MLSSDCKFFRKFLQLCHLLPFWFPSLTWQNTVIIYLILPSNEKAADSCSGKLHSVSLQLRGQAANSRGPSCGMAPTDYASTSHWSLSTTHSDEVSPLAFHVSQRSLQYSFERMGEWLCLSVKSDCQVFHCIQSFCSAYGSVQHSMTVSTTKSANVRMCLYFSFCGLRVRVMSWRYPMGEKDCADAGIWTDPLKHGRVVSGQTPRPQHT